jgi:hypothetical protein
MFANESENVGGKVSSESLEQGPVGPKASKTCVTMPAGCTPPSLPDSPLKFSVACVAYRSGRLGPAGPQYKASGSSLGLPLLCSAGLLESPRENQSSSFHCALTTLVPLCCDDLLVINIVTFQSNGEFGQQMPWVQADRFKMPRRAGRCVAGVFASSTLENG